MNQCTRKLNMNDALDSLRKKIAEEATTAFPETFRIHLERAYADGNAHIRRWLDQPGLCGELEEDDDQPGLDDLSIEVEGGLEIAIDEESLRPCAGTSGEYYEVDVKSEKKYVVNSSTGYYEELYLIGTWTIRLSGPGSASSVFEDLEDPENLKDLAPEFEIE